MEGRLFDERDGKGAPDGMIVNQTMARTFRKNERAIGKRGRARQRTAVMHDDWLVENAKNAGLDKPAGTEL
jgi:hypothetical protein